MISYIQISFTSWKKYSKCHILSRIIDTICHTTSLKIKIVSFKEHQALHIITTTIKTLRLPFWISIYLLILLLIWHHLAELICQLSIVCIMYFTHFKPGSVFQQKWCWSHDYVTLQITTLVEGNPRDRFLINEYFELLCSAISNHHMNDGNIAWSKHLYSH